MLPLSAPTRHRLGREVVNAGPHSVVRSHTPENQMQERPRQSKANHGHAETCHASQQDGLASNVVRDARPLQDEHRFRQEEDRLLYAILRIDHEHTESIRLAGVLTIIPA